MHWTTWIAVPALGALIGWITNSIAASMLFRPHSPIRVGFLTLHGLIPKRQPDLARKIGEVVGHHLVDSSDIARAFGNMDLRPMVEKLIETAMEKKLGELAAMPMIGAFLTPDRLSGIRSGIVDAVVEQEALLVGHLEQALDDHLDVAKIVAEKVASFPTTRLEQLILDVARRELRAIVALGAVLGAIIGIGQVGLLCLLP